jgi:hypothetical protein
MFTRIAFASIIFLCMLLIWEISRITASGDLLPGFWEAPTNFCEKSGIKSLQIYVSDTMEKMYIYMDSDDRTLINKCAQVSFDSHWFSNIGDNNIEYAFISSDDINPLPSTMTARFNPQSGNLVFYTPGTLQMELYKNTKATNGVF